jgi:hypothetical protein
MASMTVSAPSEMDTRVRDYLDDKIQTPADFGGLEMLVRQARRQQELLKKQVIVSTYVYVPGIWLANFGIAR